MTDLTFPPHARRFASLLDREYCVWMPSPSVALLSALVTGKGRPKRLLVLENAPAFISNIGRVAGASSVTLAPSDIDAALEALLRGEGLSPEHVWGVATHRDGKLSPTDWLSRCASAGIPTIELCMGSLQALARWGPSPATFTIVDLDAEQAFAGARLTALLASDKKVAARVQQLCLPGPEARDYIFDARPRGLADDEPALISMVEHAMALFGDKAPKTSAPSALTLPWARRFHSAEGDSSGAKGMAEAAPGPVEEHAWAARLAEAEEHHTEALRAAAANALSLQTQLEQQFALADEWQRRCRAAERAAASQAERDALALSEIQKKLDLQQRTIDQWEARFDAAESEATKDAAILSRARAELLGQKSEFEGALSSMRAERDALAQRLLWTEAERDRVVATAPPPEPRSIGELRQRIEEFEKAAAASADREARQAEAAEASRARVVRLEADAVVFGKARADLLKQKTEAENALASAQAEKQALAAKLADLDAELGEALAESAKRSAAQRAALEEQTQRAARLEGDVAKLAAAEAARAREGEASSVGLSERIAALEADLLRAGQTSALLLTQKTEKERALSALEAERDALSGRLSTLEKDRDRTSPEGAEREKTLRSAIEGLRRRAAGLEEEAAALKEREARLAKEGAAERTGLVEQIGRLEAGAVLAQKALTDLRQAKAAAEGVLTQARAESRAASEKLAEAERGHAQAAAAAEKSLSALRSTLSEPIARLEADAVLAQKTIAELREAKTAAEGGLTQARAESRAASEKLAEAEGRHAQAAAAAEKSLSALRSTLSEPIARFEADAVLAQKTIAELREAKTAAEGGREKARAESRAASEKLAEAERGRAQAAAAAEKSLLALRSTLSERIARLEADAVLAERNREQLQTQKEEAERSRAALQSEMGALTMKAAAAESARDLARADAETRGEALRAALDEQKQRSEKSKKDTAELSVREARQAQAWTSERTEMSERIARLEASAAEAETAHADLVGRMSAEAERVAASIKAEAERASSSMRAEADAAAGRLAEVEGARDLALAEAARREEAHREALEEQTARADQLERDAAVLAEHQARVTEEWGLQRAELSQRVARLEASLAEAEKARADLIVAKGRGDVAIESLRVEKDGLGRKLQAMEKDHAAALSEAVKREDAHRLALDAEKRRAGRLAGEAAALVEREARLKRESEDARAEWAERISRLEGPAALAENGHADLLAQKNDAERALAALQAERETLGGRLAELERDRDQLRADAARREEEHRAIVGDLEQRAERIRVEAEAAAEREAHQAEAREASRADLVVRIARLEAAEVVADKARTELLNRKRDSDKALAAAQSERADLLKKLAIAEREGEEARAKGPRPAPELAKPTAQHAAPAKPGEAAQPRNTGGLSALVNLWNTAVIKRPGRSKESEEKPPAPPVEPILGMEEILDQASPSSGPAPIPEGEGLPKPDPPAAPAASRKAPGERNTGGLSALVGLWNTAKTMRPSRRKSPETPPDAPIKPVLGVEESPEKASEPGLNAAFDFEAVPPPTPSSTAPPPVHGGPPPPKVNRPVPGSPPRPAPPRRPEPKPAPPADETEKLGGWLRGLAGRMRGKP